MDRRKFLKIGLKSLFILPFIKPLITMVKPKPVRAYWAGNLVCSNPKLRNLGFWDAKSNKTHQHFTIEKLIEKKNRDMEETWMRLLGEVLYG